MGTRTTVELESPSLGCGSMGVADVRDRNSVTQCLIYSLPEGCLCYVNTPLPSVEPGLQSGMSCTELHACSYEFRRDIYLPLSLPCYVILGKPHHTFGL